MGPCLLKLRVRDVSRYSQITTLNSENGRGVKHQEGQMYKAMEAHY